MIVIRKIVLPVLAVSLAVLCAPMTSEAAKPAPKKTAGSKKVAKKSAAPTPAAAASSSPSSTSPAGEWSLEEKEYWSKLEEEMKGYADSAGKKCGTKIKGSFERESFRGHLTEGGTYGLSGYARAHCQAGFSALEDLCNTDMGKASVGKKVSTVECKWGGAGKSSMDLSSSKLTTTIDMDGDNASTYTGKVTDFLKKKL